MDPNFNLSDQLDIAKEILDYCERYPYGDRYTHSEDRLAELVIALDEWITKGGFLPERWTKKV